jgi:hypothetical protein
MLALAAPVAAPPLAQAASGTKSTAAAGSKSKKSLRQFTGVVTAHDKASITVEKGGKKPRTMVFSKDAELSTTGDIEKNARVTVYYRDQDGKPVAHRVVVKGESSGSKGGR